MANEKGVLWDEFSTGGLLDDADVDIVSALFASWDYRGQVTPPVLALRVELKDSDGQVHEEYLSAGSLDILTPSADGHRALVAEAYKVKHPDWEAKSPKLNLNTNAVAFVVSLMNADTKGELKAKIIATDDLHSVIAGTKVHVIRKASKTRVRLQAAPVPGQPERAQTNLVVEKIIAYPGGTAAAATTATAAAAPAGNGAAGPSSPTADAAAGVLMAIVATEGGSIKKNQIAGKVMAQMKESPAAERNAVLGVIVRDDFLASDTVSGMGIRFDKTAGTVSLG